MRKKALIIIGVFLAFLVIQACTSSPEKNLLSRYFNAVTMNDNDTMSSMALEPLQPELGSWKIVSISPEKVEPFNLAELNQAEVAAKKAQDAQIGPTIDADTALKDAQYEKDTSRSAAGKAAAQRKIDELQKAYDIENGKMQALKKAYNDAKKAAADQETMAMFSLGVREMPTIRELTGQVRDKEVVVAITNKAGTTKNYNLDMRQYDLKDPTGRKIPSRWVIIKFEPLS